MTEEKNRNIKVHRSQSSNSDNIPTFLLKTYEILQVMFSLTKNQSYSDIVCWTKNGEGFVVKKIKSFAETILPTHFRHSNYTSFVRQLNMYDFHKTRQQNQENAFKNTMFKRGQKQLLHGIERKDYKKKKEKIEESIQKLDLTNYEDEIKNQKKFQKEKQFYANGINFLQRIQEQMSLKQTHLASIQENGVSASDQMICDLLQVVFKVKNINNDWSSRLSIMGNQWQSMLNSKKAGLKNELESQNIFDSAKKQTGPTMASFQSFISTPQ